MDLREPTSKGREESRKEIRRGREEREREEKGRGKGHDVPELRNLNLVTLIITPVLLRH